MKLRTLPVFLAFLAMGFGDAVGPFVGLARDEFQLSNAVAAMVPFTGFIMFGLLSVPMDVLQDRRGKKFVLLVGLAVALAGLLNAAFGLTQSCPRGGNSRTSPPWRWTARTASTCSTAASTR